MRHYYLLAIIAAANFLFFLVPWAHVHGSFNVSDVGLALIGLGLLYIVSKNPDAQALRNPFTGLLFIFMIFVTIQAAIASINFGQSILDGLIGARHQFYYLSFFLFLYFLDDLAKIEKFLRLIVIVAAVLVVLSLINYFGPIIFYNRAAEGWGALRSGVRRPLIPGMDIVTLALFWTSSVWLVSGKRIERRNNFIAAMFFLGAHVFRQTRGRLLPALLVLFWNMLMRRRYKQLLALGLLGVVAVAVAQLTMKQNIILYQFQSSAEDLSHGTGSWKGRMEQMEEDFRVFEEHPWFGSGAAALRASVDSDAAALQSVARKADLGYTHFLKAYGVAGMIWLGFFFFNLVSGAHRMESRFRDRRAHAVALCVKGYIYYVVVSFVTLNQLMFAYRILLVCLCAAVLVRLRLLPEERTAPAQLQVPEAQGRTRILAAAKTHTQVVGRETAYSGCLRRTRTASVGSQDRGSV